MDTNPNQPEWMGFLNKLPYLIGNRCCMDIIKPNLKLDPNLTQDIYIYIYIYIYI
jgi:hypothetical protein